MKEFNKLENELSKSICSFLSCELYWENNLDRFRNVSIKFLIFLILLVICLFSICYYLVWNLFESDYSYYNQLQIGTKLQCTVNKVVDLANLVQVVYLVNLVKSKWLCKRIKKEEEVKLENQNLEKKLINQRNQFPIEMKQSIFSVRSTSSESIRKMQLEHLRNLELHEQQRLRELELERLNENRLNEQKIIEEESFVDDEFEKKEYDNELNKNLNGDCVVIGSGRRFTNDGEIISTKSDDKESFYEEAESDLRKGSSSIISNNNELLEDKNAEKLDQRRLSKQSICTNLTCPNRMKVDNFIEADVSMQKDDDDIKIEPLEPDEEKAQNEENFKKDKEDDRSAKRHKRRFWEITGDITLLNAAKLKLLETKRAASRQLNYLDENNQSKQLCKDKKKSEKPQIELKDFSQTNFQKKVIKPFQREIEQNFSNQIDTNNSNSPNLMGSNSLSLINQLDQSKESRKKFLYKQSLSSRSSSVQTTKQLANNYGCKEMMMPQTKKIINPILNQVIYQQTKSQPPSLSVSRPASTNSTPYR